MDRTSKKYPRLGNFLSEFTKKVTAAVHVRSVILFGGIELDDFSKRYSDIDLVVVLEKGMRPKTHQAVEEAIKELYEIDSDFAQILYVYFIPYYMIESPNNEFKQMDGSIFGNENFSYFGKYPLSIMDNFSIREKGKILFDEDLRNQFPEPPKDHFWKMFIDSIPYIEKAVESYPFNNDGVRNAKTAVNWLLYFPRLLYSLLNYDIIGKSDSAFWFQKEFNNSLGEFLIEIAKCRQKNASVRDVKDLVLNSRKLILFALEKILEIKGVDANLSNVVSIDLSRVNFHLVFREFKDLL